MEHAGIKVKDRKSCPVCTSEGCILYSDLQDGIFATPGTWSMRRCHDRKCGTLWLDPTPEESELSKLYTTYYTHGASAEEAKHPQARTLLDRIRASYLDVAYGYKNKESSFIDNFLWLVAYVYPTWKDTQAADIFYLPAKSRGKLLDVGCGSGRTMQLMKEKRWEVTGTDFDKNAVTNARSKGLEVYHGELSAQNFANETFDAVVMGHVIEHVPEPLALLEECRRVLKKDGLLVVTTPNAYSPCSRYYGKNWRGLETPRHLQVFTTSSLEKLARIAGFGDIKSFTSMQSDMYIWRASRDLSVNGKHDMLAPVTFGNRILMHAISFVMGWINVLFPSHSEVAVIMCKK